MSAATSDKPRAKVLAVLEARGADGATWEEVAEALDVLHGVAAGRLSVLHDQGRVARLSERRGRAKVYVLPRFVGDRPTEPYGRVRD